MFFSASDCRELDHRPEVACEGEREEQNNPHLVIAGLEIADVRALEVAYFDAAFALCDAGGRVLACVLPAMMQEQENGRKKEEYGQSDQDHTRGLVK